MTLQLGTYRSAGKRVLNAGLSFLSCPAAKLLARLIISNEECLLPTMRRTLVASPAGAALLVGTHTPSNRPQRGAVA